MPPFPKPSLNLSYQVPVKTAPMQRHKAKPDRVIPAKSENRLLLGTWNIADLGVQERRTRNIYQHDLSFQCNGPIDTGGA